MKYEALPGQSIDQAAAESHALAVKENQTVTFDFNGKTMAANPTTSAEQIRVEMRAKLGLPAVDPPFHPQTAADALARWDAGQSVFTIEMGGLGPSYEQAIQILIFEIIRDNLDMQDFNEKSYRDFGDSTVSRIDEKMGGYSGAMVGAARQVAFRALRDGWEKTIESAPKDRHIQVSKDFPVLKS